MKKNAAGNIDTFTMLAQEIRRCQLCKAHLPLPPKPVLTGTASAKLLIIGQAPGLKVHNTGIPWNDASGERLRSWLQIDRNCFYDQNHVAIMPMGFCYPGKGKSGDLPPRPECAPTWHQQLLARLPEVQLTLLIGQYAQRYYLGSDGRNLTVRVKDWQHYLPNYFVLPHPSPRNNLWLRRNPWFEQQLVPALQTRIATLLAKQQC